MVIREESFDFVDIKSFSGYSRLSKKCYSTFHRAWRVRDPGPKSLCVGQRFRRVHFRHDDFVSSTSKGGVIARPNHVRSVKRNVSRCIESDHCLIVQKQSWAVADVLEPGQLALCESFLFASFSPSSLPTRIRAAFNPLFTDTFTSVRARVLYVECQSSLTSGVST